MSTYTQKSRPLTVTTPLGKDVLLLTELSGSESLSQLFLFKLTCLAKNGTDVAFDKLLGQKVSATIEMTGGKQRHFAGICSRASEGVRDAEFTTYHLEIVPQAWFLTRRAQSRIFQHKSVPDILKTVLEGIDTAVEIQGTFKPRDYCVQYRETDYNFAARLMEEEGIYYFFKHTAGGSKMVLANSPQSHSDVPEANKLKFEALDAGHLREDDRIYTWEKSQELRSGKYVVWDHSFELPHQHLEAENTIVDGVAAGKVQHKLKLGANGKLELYDFPGEYAQRFDGVDSGGGDRPADLQNIFQDNKRVAEIRMQEEAHSSLVIHGTGSCRNLTAGHKFTLEKHFNADGQYVLTSVQHSAQLKGDYRSDGGEAFSYRNSFACFPVGLTYRPPRNTPKPIVYGTQTAVVVGQPGDEIFTDKYGRIKVQFHWDRQGKKDANSSCWLRVGTAWAGKQWGAIHIPRVGQEVIVSFQEGDPDQPLVIGNVYNAEQMPPYKLPDNKTQSGMKSRSTLNGSPENFNELRFEDKKGEEQVYFHAEKNFDRVVENNDTLRVGFEKKGKGDQSIEIHNNQKTIIGNSKSDDGSQTIEIWKDRTETIKTGNEKLTIEKGNRDVLIDMGNDALTIKMGNQTTKLNLGKSETEAMQSIELKVGQSSIKLDQMGVTIKGMMVKVEGTIQTDIKGLMTNVNGSAMLAVKGGVTMIG